MKKLILSIVLLAAFTLTLSAARSPQSESNSVSVQGIEVVRAVDGTVGVAFQLHVGDGVTANDRSLVIRPVLRGNGGECELPPIIIRGSRAKAMAEIRAMSAAGVNHEGRYITANGTVLDYYAQTPWQEWMSGSHLVFSGLNAGKGAATEVNIGVVAENLLQGGMISYPRQDSMYASETLLAASAAGSAIPGATDGPNAATSAVSAPQVVTIGDELAARFAFVEPVARYTAALEASSANEVFDYNMPLFFGTAAAQKEDEVARFIEMTRQGAVRVQFARGDYNVDRALGENNKMLVDLISSIRLIQANSDLHISRVVVVGFSAPEGSDEMETLAMERAGGTRDFITANSLVDPDAIDIYNGSVDWATLRVLAAESNMPEKYKVLEIIDNVPVWGNPQDKSRMDCLMELGDGTTFGYIRNNFFPRLRQTGAYVKVYYDLAQ